MNWRWNDLSRVKQIDQPHECVDNIADKREIKCLGSTVDPSSFDHSLRHLQRREQRDRHGRARFRRRLRNRRRVRDTRPARRCYLLLRLSLGMCIHVQRRKFRAFMDGKARLLAVNLSAAGVDDPRLLTQVLATSRTSAVPSMFTERQKGGSRSPSMTLETAARCTTPETKSKWEIIEPRLRTSVLRSGVPCKSRVMTCWRRDRRACVSAYPISPLAPVIKIDLATIGSHRTVAVYSHLSLLYTRLTQ